MGDGLVTASSSSKVKRRKFREEKLFQISFRAKYREKGCLNCSQARDKVVMVSCPFSST